MRRPVVIAILCATLAVLGALSLWSLPKLPDWSPYWHGGSRPVAVAPPEIPTAQIPESESLTPRTNSSNLTEPDVAAAWEPLGKVASEQNFAAWAIVADADTGEVIFQREKDVPHTPASLMKLLTAYAALTVMKPTDTLRTGVSKDGSALYLWGEGDLMLAAGAGTPSATNGHAGLADLAEQVASKLGGDTQPFTLYYQDTLFDGEKRSPTIIKQEVEDWVGDIGPYAINSGRNPGGMQGYVEDSSGSVAQTLVELLKERGVTVQQIQPFNAIPPQTSTIIAQVESAPIFSQLQLMLEISDNTLAEQYCALSAKTYGTEPVNLHSSTALVGQIIADAGIDTTGLVISDCSGLDETSKVRPQMLVDLMQNSLENGSDTASLTRILPFGGMSGTLRNRFVEGSGYANITGKTGSLGHVAALASLGTTESGQNIYIVVGADNVPDDGAWAVPPLIDAFVNEILGK